MTSRPSKKSAADAWLLDESSSKRGRTGSAQSQEPAGLEASQWLRLPKPDQPPRPSRNSTGNGKRDGQREASKPQAQSRRGVLGRRNIGQGERRLEAKLRRAEGKVESQRQEIAEMRKRIETLEAELDASEQLRPPLRAAEKSKQSVDDTGDARSRRKVRINDATFEQLRSLGLSVTQSARVVAYRESRGGYQSVDELAEIPGLSRKTVIGLRESVQI
jgi:DNA uptake protein ComE-like DNA-binding protein